MPKQLVITEKPSVARDIAKALGGFSSSGGIYESDEYVIAPAVGHLLELVDPGDAPAKKRPAAKKAPAAKRAAADGPKPARKPGKWSLESLPVVPERFHLQPIKSSEDRLRDIRRQLKRDDIDGLINACDAGREGELIFHNIVRHFRETRPVRRLWLQSMTPAAIRQGFGELLPGERMRPLQAAAVSRSESDWLVGINSTRALTAINSPKGSFNLTTVGRVQTPTLAMIVEREREIRAFVPRDYWEVAATFAAEGGEYDGRWLDPAHKPGGPADKPSWIMSAERAEEIAARVAGKTGTVSEEKKPQKSPPPLLFDLTSLQRAANRRFGFSARSTLSIAQALYESRAITYPRTDSRRLPSDYPDTVRKTLGMLAEGPLSSRAALVRRVLDENWVRPGDKRIFDDSKVSDHFAIIPTGEPPGGTREQNHKLYGLIATTFVAAFYPAAQLEITVRRTEVAGETFETRGRVVIDPGWMAVAGRPDPAAGKGEADADSRELAPVRPGEEVSTESAEAEKKETKPPKRYTEATLLSAMESAGKRVEDEELRESLKERGLGTPATRASIIEGLVREKYIVREQRELAPSQKAFTLMELLGAMNIEALTKPELTGDWESKLKRVESADYAADEFMEEIRSLTRQIVAASKKFDLEELEGREREPTGVRCPVCGEGDMGASLRNYRCGACGYMIKKAWCARELSPDELRVLCEEGSVGPFDDFFSARTRRPFTAGLKLNEQKMPEFDLGERKGTVDPEDLHDRLRVGKCPCGEAEVVELPAFYVCERSVGDPPGCKFRIWRKILQREIQPDEMSALLRDRIVGPMSGFVSKRTRRGFSAKLKLEDKGGGEYGIGFEFDKTPKGKAKPKGRPKAKPKSAAAARA